MKTLIAVKSCNQHWMAEYHDPIKATWAKDIPPGVDLRFFTGNSASWLLYDPAIVHLNVPDDYMSLPLKTKAILEWSLKNGYDFSFLCDTDTFIIPRRLFSSGYDKFDYAGRFGPKHPVGTTFNYTDKFGKYPNCYPWASGGVGYFLSKKASLLLSQDTPSYWAEDLWVGQVLGPYIRSGEIRASDLPIECDSAWHFPRQKYGNASYDPRFGWMEQMYADHR